MEDQTTNVSKDHPKVIANHQQPPTSQPTSPTAGMKNYARIVHGCFFHLQPCVHLFYNQLTLEAGMYIYDRIVHCCCFHSKPCVHLLF